MPAEVRLGSRELDVVLLLSAVMPKVGALRSRTQPRLSCIDSLKRVAARCAKAIAREPGGYFAYVASDTCSTVRTPS